MDTLAAGIAHDFEEYRSLEAAIGTSASSSALDPMIRQAIERNIVSPQKRRDRRNIYVLVLLGLLVFLNLTPISVSQFIYAYFGIPGDSPDIAGEGVVSTVIIGAVVIALLLLFLAELVPKLFLVLDRLRQPFWLVGLGAAVIIAAGIGYWVRDLAISESCFLVACFFHARFVCHGRSRP